MKKFWTPHLDNILRRHYARGDLQALAERLSVSVYSIKARAFKLGLHRKVRKRQPWTERQLVYLRAHYADMPAEDIGKAVNHTKKSVWSVAHKLGLQKSPEFRARCGHRVASTEESRRHRFVKGQSPPNKGKRLDEFMSAESIAHTLPTRFQAGHRPHNWREVGSEYTRADGYVYVRTPDGFRPKNRLVWEQAHGPIPEGYVVAYKDGDRQNCQLDNLYLVSRQDWARLRIANETTEQRKQRLAKANVTRSKSIRRDKIRIHFGLEPYGKLVKKW